MRAAIVLAAGRSRRFGARDKRLARVGGHTLIERAVALARAAPVGRVILVTDGAVRFRPPGVTIVRAKRAVEGMGESLKAGLAVLTAREDAVFVFLADMPAIDPTLSRRMAARLRRGVTAVRPAYRGRPGHPVLVRRPSRELRARIGGDRGLAPLLGGEVRTVSGGRGCVLDVDRPGDLRRLTPLRVGGAVYGRKDR